MPAASHMHLCKPARWSRGRAEAVKPPSFSPRCPAEPPLALLPLIALLEMITITPVFFHQPVNFSGAGSEFILLSNPLSSTSVWQIETHQYDFFLLKICFNMENFKYQYIQKYREWYMSSLVHIMQLQQLSTHGPSSFLYTLHFSTSSSYYFKVNLRSKHIDVNIRVGIRHC